MDHIQRSEIVDRLERRHEDLIEQLDTLNQRIEQVLGGLTLDRDDVSGAELRPNSPAA